MACIFGRQIEEIDNSSSLAKLQTDFHFISLPLFDYFKLQPDFERYHYYFPPKGEEPVSWPVRKIHIRLPDIVEDMSWETLKTDFERCPHISSVSIRFALKTKHNLHIAKAVRESIGSGERHELGILAVHIDVPIKFGDEDTWEWWQRFRTGVRGDHRVVLGLELSSDLPSMEELQRWKGENLKSLIIPTSTFEYSHGIPFLPLHLRQFVRDVCKARNGYIELILSGTALVDITTYLDYLDYMLQDFKNYSQSKYNDLRMILRQPDRTLTIPEHQEIVSNRPKYIQYQRAIFDALNDRGSDADEVICVVFGAGCVVELINLVLLAAKKLQTKVKVYVVENDLDLCVELEARIFVEWGTRVVLVKTDINDWEPVEKADLAVFDLSESFPDHGMAPERLNLSSKVLKSDGICIPSSYTLYLSPVMAPRIYATKNRDWVEREFCPEVPCLVNLSSYYQISPSQQVFEFLQPFSSELAVPTERSCSVEFAAASLNSMFHGFLCHCTALLYDNIWLSNHPKTVTQEMASWSPTFFPLRVPEEIQKGVCIHMDFRRRVDNDCVWYEWSITKPFETTAHNWDGDYFKVRSPKMASVDEEKS